jgi:hypothetical protein
VSVSVDIDLQKCAGKIMLQPGERGGKRGYRARW